MRPSPTNSPRSSRASWTPERWGPGSSRNRAGAGVAAGSGGDGAPGWWSSPAKTAALTAFNQQSDPAKRAALWGKVQQVVYDEVPYINVGKFASLSAKSPALDNYVPATWPFFWNARVSAK